MKMRKGEQIAKDRASKKEIEALALTVTRDKVREMVGETTKYVAVVISKLMADVQLLHAASHSASRDLGDATEKLSAFNYKLAKHQRRWSSGRAQELPLEVYDYSGTAYLRLKDAKQSLDLLTGDNLPEFTFRLAEAKDACEAIGLRSGMSGGAATGSSGDSEQGKANGPSKAAK